MSAQGIAVVLALTTGSACTHWGTVTTYGPRREVARRLLGVPQVAQTSTSSMSAGFAGSSAASPDGRRTGLVAGLSGSSGSMTRTHCIQEAEIDYEQPYQATAKVEGRALDVIGGVVLGLVGVSTMLTAHQRAQGYDPFNPDGVSETPGLLLGGAMVGGGVGWIWYANSRLPKGPPPSSQPQFRRWTTTEFVEATGCGLVPADQPTAPATPAAAAHPPAAGASDVAERLKQLEDLRSRGLITEDEYQAKRKVLIDQL